MIVADIIVLVILAPFVTCALYLVTLTAFAVCSRPRIAKPAARMRTFSIVVPAHNEEATLPTLLESIAALHYAPGNVVVHVIADNCSDATAAVARAAGATVHERADSGHRGKGTAISWLMFHPAFRGEMSDAVVFLDADCVVSPNLLDAFNRRLDAGELVLQAYYDIRDGDRSPTLQLRQCAFALVHLLRPAAKMAFGGSAGLKGTGMCVERGLLKRLGWAASGLAEDVEQHLRLVYAGQVVSFVREARVSGEMPRDLARAHEQHRRWEAGRLHALRAYVPRLLARGVMLRSAAMLDAAFEQLVPPLSVLVAILAAGLASAVYFGLTMSSLAALVALAAVAAYVAGGVWMLRPRPLALLQAAAVAPWYVVWKLATYARAIATSRGARWLRTPRDETA